MAHYFCNPLNFSYQYQFNQEGELFHLNREAADPSMILFKGRYYIFPSMTRGFLVSNDMVNWELKPLPDTLPLYDYAPDVRALGEWMYFCASRRFTPCDFYRTKDPESGDFERFEGTFDFWDPNLFPDDDGRLYFYWGCSNVTPICGVELDPETMKPLTEPVALIHGRKAEHGFERFGENHRYSSEGSAVAQMLRENAAKQLGCRPEDITDLEPIIASLPGDYQAMARAALSDDPYIEGAWMTKHDGRYYLQYAVPGTQFNIYADAVYVSDAPLGPFVPAANNPFSYSPGGFLPGAGHGSTMEDKSGNWWHVSTMRISMNHNFERRIGIWPAGFDADGELFCNTRYGDWPQRIDVQNDPWKEPEWMLLSYGKSVTASSEACPAANVVNEDVQNWWKAASDDPQPTLTLDLGSVYDVRAVQINFADDMGLVSLPEGAKLWGDEGRGRYIEERKFTTRWLLETSTDGENWQILEDKRNAVTDLSHDLVLHEDGIPVRYLRLSHMELPYGQTPCVSGLRVFGRGHGPLPAAACDVAVDRYEDLSMKVTWHPALGIAEDETAAAACAPLGYEVLWGHAENKLYHSMRVFGKCEADIRALVKGQKYFVRVDAFNEVGITHGNVIIP